MSKTVPKFALVEKTIRSLVSSGEAPQSGDFDDPETGRVDELIAAVRDLWPTQALSELDLRRRQMSRFPFCPDHRDKVLGKPCRECEVERLRSEVARLEAWLYRIDGGDNPCRDEEQLRQWAYEALTLGRPAPGGQP